MCLVILFIKDQKIREVIIEQTKDIRDIFLVKNKSYYLFTLNLNVKTIIRGNSLTTLLNKVFQLLEKTEILWFILLTKVLIKFLSDK